MKTLIAFLVSLAVLLSPAAVIPASAVSTTSAAATAAAAAESVGSVRTDQNKPRKKPAKKKSKKAKKTAAKNKQNKNKAWNYRVKNGVTFNNPHRRSDAWKIVDKMIRAINHVPRGHTIRIMTWNFQSRSLTRALIRAHQRGVGVRLIMSRQLAQHQNPRDSYKTLRRALSRGDKKRPGRLTSFTRTCSNSCRGTGSAMHSKLMLISKSGRSRHIVMQGSGNFTNTAATMQWNDWYTKSGNRRIFKGWAKVFKQALRDRPAKPYQFTVGNTYSWFAPRTGASDPVMDLLEKVRCKRAGKAGIKGRTVIRVGQAVFADERGLRIAKMLRKLESYGCNIRVVATMFTSEIRRALGGVPTRQMVYDWDGDGAFDRYLHMKAMSIVGRFGKRKNQHVVLTSAANWSNIGMTSDEQGMVIRHGGVERSYRKQINWIFDHAPRRMRPMAREYHRQGLPDPYRNLELELAGQG